MVRLKVGMRIGIKAIDVVIQKYDLNKHKILGFWSTIKI